MSSVLVTVIFTKPSGNTDEDQFALVLSGPATPQQIALDLAQSINALSRYNAWATGSNVSIEPRLNNRSVEIISAIIT